VRAEPFNVVSYHFILPFSFPYPRVFIDLSTTSLVEIPPIFHPQAMEFQVQTH
jgi:hypothetical protein